MSDTTLRTRERLLPVVVVEDEEGVNRLISKSLRRLGFETIAALDGETGIHGVQKHAGEVILLLDYTLPDMQAPEVLDRIETELGQLPPFVIITGQGDERVAVDMMNRGASDYLLKDNDFLDLVPHVVERLHGRIEKEQELSAANTRLSKSEATFESAMDHAPIGMGIVDLEECWQQVNRAICEMFRSTAEDLLGRDILEHFPTEVRADIAKAFHEVTQGDIPAVEIEQPFLRRNGDRGWCLLSASAVKDNSRPVSCVVQMQDITASRAATEQVRRQAALLDETNDAVLVLDANHNLNFWNAGAERLWGWPREEMNGKHVHKLLGADVDTAPLDALLQTTVSEGNSQAELTVTTREGELRTVEIRCNTLPAEGDGILAVGTDITEKKKIESHYLRSQRLEGIGKLASGVAHDLNNVLAPILYAFPLLRNPDTGRDMLTEVVDTLESSVNRGSSIVRQLLAFGRGMESDHLVFQCRHIISEMVQMSRQTFPHNIEIIDEVPKDLWTIRGDETQFHQILLNFCVNARDAMPDGGAIHITAENIAVDERFVAMESRAAKGPWICIAVADTGDGIPPEVREHIFDPFFTTKDVGKGTGLGLSTVMGIVKSHQGFLDLESEPGRGTTFKVYLPAEPFEDDPQADAENPIPRGRGQTVLLVEDDDAICMTSEELLRQQGYHCQLARTGIEGAALFHREAGNISLVIASLKLPEMDGATLIRIIKRTHPELPAIITTGYPEERLLKPLEGERKLKILLKPHSSEQLLRTAGEMIAAETLD